MMITKPNSSFTSQDYYEESSNNMEIGLNDLGERTETVSIKTQNLSERVSKLETTLDQKLHQQEEKMNDMLDRVSKIEAQAKKAAKDRCSFM